MLALSGNDSIQATLAAQGKPTLLIEKGGGRLGGWVHPPRCRPEAGAHLVLLGAQRTG